MITALYSDNLTNKDFLTYGAGNLWTIGNTEQLLYMNAYSIQTIAATGGQYHYHNSAYNIYNYGRSAYDLQIDNTGATFNTPLTASYGISGSFGQLNSTFACTTVKPAGTLASRSTIGHRLTLTSATPVTTTDVTGATTIYLTPHTSNQIALYNGTVWLEYEVDEISLALGTLTSGKNYDVFVYDNAGTVAMELTAWSTDTVRVTALVRQNGVWVKTGALTRRYVGTIRTTATTTTEDSISKRFVWNQYNQVKRALRVIESTSSWSHGNASWRQVRSVSTNRVEYVSGQADTLIYLNSHAIYYSTTTTVTCMGGVGVDSTTVNSAQVYGGSNCAVNIAQQDSAEYQGYPGLGYHAMNWLEYGGTNVNFIGTFSVAQYQSGMMGELNG